MMETFNDYAKQYLAESAFEKAHSTYVSERSKVKNLVSFFGKKQVRSISQSDIKRWKIKVHRRFSNKTINEHFTILRAIFACALSDGVLDRNPITGIENLKTHTAEPNPLCREELLKLHAAPTQCESGKALLFLGVLTGLRISELIALIWDCVDFEAREIKIHTAKVLGKYKVPKTSGSIRTVEMNQHALALLKKHYEVTGSLRPRVIRVLQNDNKTLDKQRVQHVFINSETNKPFIDSKQYSKTFFTPLLAKASVRHRGPNQLRHTFASQCLTAGISKEWIARQLGHNSTNMVDKHYARWLQSDAPDNAGKFGEAIASVFAEPSAKPSDNSKLIQATFISSWGATSHNPITAFAESTGPLREGQSSACGVQRRGGLSHV
ncbi:MAG: integrase [Oleiphilaceae bacterium]|jgi:integrase